ncbi:MAG: HupE/UreJ family protein [Pseudohongiellaceae bacterium]
MTQNSTKAARPSQVRARICLAALVTLLCCSVQAHDLNVTGVARVFLDEELGGNYRLSVADQQVPPLFNVARILPDRCIGLPSSRYSYRFRCLPALNSSDELLFPWGFQGLVVLAKWQDGNAFSTYFPGETGQIKVPLSELKAGAESVVGLASRYLKLGTEHILFGIDHLLFLIGLLLLIRGVKMLVATITAFTVAHSITLASSVLGLFPLPGPPVEALIALSIVLLAREVVLGQRGLRTLSHTKPWLLALGFGLVHGFGFASAIGELGVASEDIPLALLFFNVGVEAGQLGFVVAALLLAYLFKRVKNEWVRIAELGIAYGLGGVALFWFSERLPAVFWL